MRRRKCRARLVDDDARRAYPRQTLPPRHIEVRWSIYGPTCASTKTATSAFVVSPRVLFGLGWHRVQPCKIEFPSPWRLPHPR